MFARLGRFAYRRRWAVLVATAVFAVIAAAWGSGVVQAMSSGGYEAPDSETLRASALLEDGLGRDGRPDVVAVYHDRSGKLTVDDPEFAQAVTTALDGLPTSAVMSSLSYWNRELGDDERAELVSSDRHATYAVLTLVGQDTTERVASYAAIVDQLRADGLETLLGGGLTSEQQLQDLAANDLAAAQLITLPLLFLLLVMVFRGLVAAAMPLLLGILAILGALVLLRALTAVTEVSIFALEITVLLGLGLAIDYGLFIVSRFRDELNARGDVAQALSVTVATAGHTVAFSGLTVVAALAGLLLFPQPASRSFGLGGITVVLFNIVAAVIVLPALLAVLGPRINALRLPWQQRGTAKPGEGRWARFAAAVMRRPVAWLAVSGVALLIAAAPLLSLQPGMTNHRYLPVENEGQASLAMIREEFPEGGPGTTTGAAGIDIAIAGNVDDSALDAYVERLDGLSTAAGAEIRNHASDLTHVLVGYRGEADDQANIELVRQIRAEAPPTGAAQVLVGGAGGPASALDNNEATLAALPDALLYIVAVTLILLFLALRSALLPIKAILSTFLSMAASFGIIVWGFQNGGFAPILGFEPVGTTDVWTLGLIFVIAFGLATDYELFLVSRIREEHLATGDNLHSVTTGLQHTGQIITSAAALMVIVLGITGVTSGSLFLMTFGVGLSVTIIIDATITRAVLVPATMRLLRTANWWPGTRPCRDSQRGDADILETSLR